MKEGPSFSIVNPSILKCNGLDDDTNIDKTKDKGKTTELDKNEHDIEKYFIANIIAKVDNHSIEKGNDSRLYNELDKGEYDLKNKFLLNETFALCL